MMFPFFFSFTIFKKTAKNSTERRNLKTETIQVT